MGIKVQGVPNGNNWYFYTSGAPMPGACSQAVGVLAGGKRLLFLAGQTGNIPDGRDEPVIEGGLGSQTTQTLKNILAVVEVAGGDVHDIVELKVFLKDSEESGKARRWQQRAVARKEFNAAYVKFFAERGRAKDVGIFGNLPARTMVWVAEVPLEYPAENTLIEITAMAVIPEKK